VSSCHVPRISLPQEPSTISPLHVALTRLPSYDSSMLSSPFSTSPASSERVPLRLAAPVRLPSYSGCFSSSSVAPCHRPWNSARHTPNRCTWVTSAALGQAADGAEAVEDGAGAAGACATAWLAASAAVAKRNRACITAPTIVGRGAR